MQNYGYDSYKYEYDYLDHYLAFATMIITVVGVAAITSSLLLLPVLLLIVIIIMMVVTTMNAIDLRIIIVIQHGSQH